MPVNGKFYEKKMKYVPAGCLAGNRRNSIVLVAVLVLVLEFPFVLWMILDLD